MDVQASWKHFYVGIAKLLSIKPWVKCFEIPKVKDLPSAAVLPECGNTWWVSLGTCRLWFGLEACSLGQQLVTHPGSHLGNGCDLTSVCDSICGSSCLFLLSGGGVLMVSEAEAGGFRGQNSMNTIIFFKYLFLLYIVFEAFYFFIFSI